ncbi:hypothetical protein [Microbacterium gubbeenense]|uniref:hypothetical protein n=1 Tax=Microbacterium gubbeenense TaxID=159896 RepID=UPI003F9AE516
MTEAARPGVYTPAGRGMDPEEIWALGRPELDAIQHEAARRIVSPWAMLGMALGQSLCAIPYTVRYRSDLMPEGTPLNLATVIVGGPGAGKSTADLAAQTLFAFGGEAAPDMEQVRSGEGIVGVFAYLEEHEDDDGRKRRRTRYRRATHAHRILWDEVRAFGAQASRTGSTLVDTVNTAVTGGTLGGQASKGDGITLARGDYRAVLSINAQPASAGALVDGAALDRGLTARLQWFAATSTARADLPRPPAPAAWVDVPTDQWEGVDYIDALGEMNAQHEADKRAGLREDVTAENAHRTTRGAILAAALANLAGRAQLIPEDWHAACAILAHGDAVLERVREALAQPDPAEEDRRQRVERNMLDALAKHRAAGLSFGEARRKLSRPQGNICTEMLHAGTLPKW